MIRLVKALIIVLILLFGLALLLYVLRFPIMTGLADLLVINDPLQPADIVFVLNGDVTTRPFRAAELYQQGLADHIVIARAEDTPPSEMGLYPNSTDVAVRILDELGVPDQDITVIQTDGGVTSTRDETRVLREYLEQHELRRVIVVTSAFHTRRVKWIVDKELSKSEVDIRLTAVPDTKFDETNWWQSERGLITFTNEYIKLFYYFAVY